MPVVMKYVDNGIGTIYLGTGNLTGKDIIKAEQKQLSNNEMLKRRKWFLADFSEVDKIEISKEEIEQIVNINLEMSGVSGTNLIAMTAKKDLIQSLIRLWEVYLEKKDIDWHINVFRNGEEAEIWLKNEVKKLYNMDITLSFIPEIEEWIY